jgi:hypothetical protein
MKPQPHLPGRASRPGPEPQAGPALRPDLRAFFALQPHARTERALRPQAGILAELASNPGAACG